MKEQRLNYECKMITENQVINEFDFHSESKSLAQDHMIHCMYVDGADYCLYRKKISTNWRKLVNNRKK